MKSFAAVATLLSLAQGIFALTINTPTNVVVCQPILLTWADGSAPYYLSMIPGGQAAAPAIKTFPTQNGNSLTWNVDIPAGTAITISLKDSSGAQAYSDIVTINGQSDTSCLNQSSSDGSSPSTAGNTAASGTTVATGATTTAAPAGTTAGTTADTSKGSVSKTTSATVSKTTGGATPASTSNAAFKSNVGVYGVAGVMAMVGLAVI